MQAIIHRRYGGPEALSLEEVEPPVPADDGILVGVRAASVNAYDWHMLRGKPYIARLTEGLRRPRDPAMGVDVAGVVQAIGSAVTHVQPGDAVFGARNGAFAQAVAGKTFVRKPVGLTFEAAAAVPMAGCTALQALRDHGNVQPGQRVLVTGAGGGVGTFAVQIARVLGADVTAMTSPSKIDLVRALGVEDVLDHTRTDVTGRGRRYDLIVDVASDRSVRDLQRALTANGTLVLVGPGSGEWIGPIARIAGALVRSRTGRQTLRTFLAEITREDLETLAAWIDAGRLTPAVDRTFPLAETSAAIRYVESGATRGKVVITI